MAFVIPSIFTAVDRISGPSKIMGTSLNNLANNSARVERSFNSTSKEMLSFAGSAAAVTTAIAAVAFSGKAIVDYQSEIANLSAVTGAAGTDLDIFKGKIQDVAKVTKTSSVDVAKAFTAIANNQPELLKDAEGLAAVTKASIILAQAAKMELAPAGEALTQILNKFGKGAKDAAKLIDILASGSVAGSSEIRDTAAAIQQFGTVAVNTGVKLNESVALIELVSKFEKGSEAGIKLRNILLEMSKGVAQDPKATASMQKLGVNINKVANSSIPLVDRLKEISKIAKDNATIIQVFGKENAAVATGLLNSIGDFDKYVAAVDANGQAAKMAATNNNTFAKSVEQLRDRFITILTGSDKVNFGLNLLMKTTQFLTENLDVIVSLAAPILGFFVLWKGYLLSTKVYLFALSKGMAIYNFLAGAMAVATGSVTGSLLAEQTAVLGVRAAIMFLNASLLTQAGVVGVAIFAISKLVTLFTDSNDSLDGMIERLGRAQTGFEQIAKPISRAQVELAAYNDAVEKYNKGQIAKAVYEKALEQSQKTKTFNPDVYNLSDELKKYPNEVPKKVDFFSNPSDTTQFENNSSADSSYKKPIIATDADNRTVFNVHVNVDKDGRVSTSANSNTGGPVPISITQTGQYLNHA